MWPLLIVIAILLVVLLWFARSRGLIGRPPLAAAATPAPSEDPTKMPGIQVHIIVWYLLILGLALVVMEIALLSLDFPDTPQFPLTPEPPPAASKSPQTGQPPSGGQANAETTTPTSQNSPTPIPEPVIDYVLPESIAPGSTNMWVTVYGQNFSETSKIRLNGKLVAMRRLSPNLLGAQIAATEAGNAGTLTVDVVDGDRTSNSLIVRVHKPKVPLNVFYLRPYWEPWINREVQLLLIITLAGALGTFVHILKSATAFIGNGTMKASWFWWYITGPLVGAAMALIFYAVLRGGFLVGTPADEKFVNPFGAFVIGALVGMFSDKASLKLAEIFDTIFRSGDPRGGKLTAPAITSFNPPQLKAGLTTAQTIIIKGERLGKVKVVRFNSSEVPAQVISDTEVRFTLASAQLATAKTLQVVVVDPDAGPSASAPFKIVGATISGPATLPDATQNTAYDQKFTAVDGTEPYQWSTSSGNLPVGLAIDPASGRLSGTPTTAGTSSFTVKVTDANNVSGEKPYTLKVK